MPEPTPGRLPPWLKKSIPAAPSPALASCLADLRLDTVCRGARCPNRLDCHHRGRAAFLIMGPNCSRACRFCAIPADPPLPLDPGEPERLGQAAARLALRHVVVTSVTRDDLPDGGAGHFAATIRELRRQAPAARLEILVPDFAGNLESWAVVVDAAPDVFNHNLETVPRLYPLVRPGADYRRSLDLLTFARERAPGLATKSGIMLGLGEETAEVLQAGKDLLAAGVDMLTV
ncbi:MAG: lipoyl synthase, partial [Planctomycetota bacterium]|nr:lipoyl synthase [Planctomycetota bacterium]